MNNFHYFREHDFRKIMFGKINVWKILPALIFFFLANTINAQTIQSFENSIGEMDEVNSAYLQSLVRDLHTSVYLDNGIASVHGDGLPVVANCDAGSIQMLYGNNPAFRMVELLGVTINSADELPGAIDLNRLRGFENLRYLYIVFAYDACGDKSDDCLAGILAGIIRGADSPSIVLYRLSIPE